MIDDHARTVVLRHKILPWLEKAKLYYNLSKLSSKIARTQEYYLQLYFNYTKRVRKLYFSYDKL